MSRSVHREGMPTMTADGRFSAADVVVPVYNAPADVRACVASVLLHLRPDVRLVLIDDASPDPAIPAYFAELEGLAHPQLLLLRNEQNLGFTGTANRGMQLSCANVVLLNSDTVVTRGWLDALLHCAATDLTIGTITPFSNNAEICSFPRFCEDNPWPAERDAEPERAAIAAAAVPTYPDLPTGVGFCLFLRRAMLDEIGIFDPAFGGGTARRTICACVRHARAGATCSRTMRSLCMPGGVRSWGRSPNSGLATRRCCWNVTRTISTWCTITLPQILSGRCAKPRCRALRLTRPKAGASCTSSITTGVAPKRMCAR